MPRLLMFVKNVARTVCSADHSLGKAAAAVALAAVVSTSPSLAIAQEAFADVAGLTPGRSPRPLRRGRSRR